MKRTFASVLAGAALLVPAAGRAQDPGIVPGICGTVTPGPFAFVVVGPVCTNLSSLITFNTGTGLFNLTVTDVTVGGGLVNNLTLTMKPDPFITFGVATTNLTPTATTYGFFFGTLIEPGLYSRATSTGMVTVTSGLAGSATVGQNSGEEFITVFGTTGFIARPLGVDIGTGTCTAGGTPTTCMYPPPAGGPAENTFEPMFLDNLEVILTYTQTGVGSQAVWSGRAEVFMAGDGSGGGNGGGDGGGNGGNGGNGGGSGGGNGGENGGGNGLPPSVVPEPATIGLVLTGMVGLLGVGVVRRRGAVRTA